jgi:hypothetical protein
MFDFFAFESSFSGFSLETEEPAAASGSPTLCPAFLKLAFIAGIAAKSALY